MDEAKEWKLKFYQIALMYVGALMGAGYASGKEMWQFFGVFGLDGIKGICVAAFFFFLFGYLSVANAKMADSAEFGKMICPVENEKLEKIINGIMSVFLWMAYLSMVSAGGALIQEQISLHHSIGSAIYMLLVVLTATKGFSVVSKRVQKVTPILVCGSLLIALYILFHDYGQIGQAFSAEASPLADNWLTASTAFVSYNLTAALPILGNCQRHAEWKDAKWGAFVGGLALIICCTILYLTMLTNPEVASSIPLPMLGFSGLISPMLRMIYACFLLIAIFGTATSCLYGITTALPEKHHLGYVWAVALIGYGLSLFGFNNIVAILYPIGGYFSMVFFILMAINYVRLKKK